MFTGLVQGVGRVEHVERVGEGIRVGIDLGTIGASASEGDSVAIHGVCLTVVSRRGSVHTFDIVAQTLRLTTLGGLAKGASVNVELALRAGDPLGGHLVQGHVEALGEVVSIAPVERDHRVRVNLTGACSGILLAQGSITVDGVSLTIARCGADWFEVALIPETLARTTLGSLTLRSRVNLEFDAIARLVDAAVKRHLSST